MKLAELVVPCYVSIVFSTSKPNAIHSCEQQETAQKPSSPCFSLSACGGSTFFYVPSMRECRVVESDYRTVVVEDGDNSALE